MMCADRGAAMGVELRDNSNGSACVVGVVRLIPQTNCDPSCPLDNRRDMAAHSFPLTSKYLRRCSCRIILGVESVLGVFQKL